MKIKCSGEIVKFSLVCLAIVGLFVMIGWYDIASIIGLLPLCVIFDW